MKWKPKLYIIPQRYQTAFGTRPLSFAVYRGRTFLCYSWSLVGAWKALQLIRRISNDN